MLTLYNSNSHNLLNIELTNFTDFHQYSAYMILVVTEYSPDKTDLWLIHLAHVLTETFLLHGTSEHNTYIYKLTHPKNY